MGKIKGSDKANSGNGKFQLVSLLVVVLCLLGLYVLVPGFQKGVNTTAVLLSRGDIRGISSLIQDFGIWAPVISILLMMFQSVLAPLPAFVITFANAMVFGWFQGILYSWVGAMFGATLCFYIARLLGRPVTVKLISKVALDKMDHFFDIYGQYTILICRLVPFISFDVVSYAAGLTDIGLGSFLIATGLGQLPATVVYSVVGGTLSQGPKMILYGILGFCLLIVASLVIKRILLQRQQRR
ncbi:alkaline phosphatase like protein [Agrilactobacillus composti DSM 18527 = JCM 14202]|uniref:TVP38/TMEM64 family protein n=1 Tax=Agrilactobacillus composti TaxID=398555 RepID=UPI00042DE2BA|nr:TVP38/TMEM64 family protein [Agrilactobacillus composti]GAF38262.1 alkaline phosphatase like protein [Agrilactobacillus composti DSM 18527 = JCM 14202]